MTTTTKTIREVQYIGPDGQPIDFIPGQEPQFAYDQSDYQNYQLYQQQQLQQQLAAAGQLQYNRPPTPPTPSERSSSPQPNHRVPGRNCSV